MDNITNSHSGSGSGDDEAAQDNARQGRQRLDDRGEDEHVRRSSSSSSSSRPPLKRAIQSYGAAAGKVQESAASGGPRPPNAYEYGHTQHRDSPHSAGSSSASRSGSASPHLEHSYDASPSAIPAIDTAGPSSSSLSSVPGMSGIHPIVTATSVARYEVESPQQQQQQQGSIDDRFSSQSRRAPRHQQQSSGNASASHAAAAGGNHTAPSGFNFARFGKSASTTSFAKYAQQATASIASPATAVSGHGHAVSQLGQHRHHDRRRTLSISEVHDSGDDDDDQRRNDSPRDRESEGRSGEVASRKGKNADFGGAGGTKKKREREKGSGGGGGSAWSSFFRSSGSGSSASYASSSGQPSSHSSSLASSAQVATAGSSQLRQRSQHEHGESSSGTDPRIRQSSISGIQSSPSAIHPYPYDGPASMGSYASVGGSSSSSSRLATIPSPDVLTSGVATPQLVTSGMLTPQQQGSQHHQSLASLGGIALGVPLPSSSDSRSGHDETSPLDPSGADAPHLEGTSASSGLMMLPSSFARLQKARRYSYSASYTLTENAHSMSSAGSSGFQSLSASNSRRMRGRHASGGSSGFQDLSGSSGSPTAKRKAEGLVAMAYRPTNTSDSQKVVVAGRSSLKVLSIVPGTTAQNLAPSPSPNPELESNDSYFSNPSAVRFRESAFSSVYDHNEFSLESGSPRSRYRIEQDLDLQEGLYNLGGKNSKAALINDVAWGYDSTANKIMTGNSNGTVSLYDVEKSGSKLERLKTHHQSGRAINVVSFAGPQGTLLASGCQDGEIKLSDIRHTSLITLTTPLDPVRSICFPPRFNCSADPFHLISASESGNIARWDLRAPKVPLDRIMAHQGGALTLDWRASTGELIMEGPLNDGERRMSSNPTDSWGWLATGGMDGTVKIWDMSSHLHTPHLVHTLHVSRPIHLVRWHTSPKRPCDLLVVPTSGGSSVNQIEDKWQPDLEIWDVRKEYLPKETFWTNGTPIAAMSPACNSDVIWTLNRSSATFEQIDTAREGVEPIGYVPKVAVAWAPEGTLAFAVKNASSSRAVVEDEAEDAEQIRASPEDPASPHEQSAGLVQGIDPTSDLRTFRFLADNYRTRPTLGETLIETCDHNAHVAMGAERFDLAKIWALAGRWLEELASARAADNEDNAKLQAATLQVKPDGSTVPSNTERAKPTKSGSGRDAGKERSLKSPSTPFHRNQRELHQYASKHSSPLVTSQVLSEADISPRPLPLRLPPARAEPPPLLSGASRRLSSDMTGALDLVGSDTSTSEDGLGMGTLRRQPSTSAATSPAVRAASETALTTSSSSDDEDSNRDRATDVSSSAVGGSSKTKAPGPGMPISASNLLTKTKPALPTISRQNTIDMLPAARSLSLHRDSSSSGHSASTYGGTGSGGSAVATPRPMTAALRQGPGGDLLPLGEISASALARRAATMGSSSSTSSRRQPRSRGGASRKISSGTRRSSNRSNETTSSNESEDEESTSDQEQEVDGDEEEEDDEDHDEEEEEHSKTARGLRARAERKFMSIRRGIAKRSRSKEDKSKTDSQDRSGVRHGRGRGGRVIRRDKLTSGSRSNSNSRRNASKARAAAAERRVAAQLKAAREKIIDSTRAHLLDLTQELADEGEIQTSATLAALLRPEMTVYHIRLERITSAYVELLRRLDCHLAGADIIKVSPVESLRAKGQENTTLHTACGKCQKGIVSAPYGKCKRCRVPSTICSICHQVETSLFVFCATCGHGAHEECLYSYAAELSFSAYSPAEGYETATEDEDIAEYDEDYDNVNAGQDGAIRADAVAGADRHRHHPHQNHHHHKNHGLKKYSGHHQSASSTATTAATTPATTEPSSPAIVSSSASSGHWLFPSEHALFSSSGFPSRSHSRATSPTPDLLDALESRATLLAQCPSGCGHSCLLSLPLSEL